MADNELRVIVKAKELATHSFRLTSNPNRYPKKYRHSLCDAIQNKSLTIYTTLFEANRIDNKKHRELRCDKEYLAYCLEVIREYLDTLGLSLNGKTQIFPFKNGVSYLGFHTYVTGTGKVIRKLKNQNKRNAQRKFLKMAKLVVAGKLPIEKFNASYTAWKNHISHGNCYRLGKAMDEKIEEIIHNKGSDVDAEQNLERKHLFERTD